MRPPTSEHLGLQVLWLILLAIPIACVAWTITHEEVFKEPREFFVRKSHDSRSIWIRKFFYLFICEYCFSHYVTLFFLALTRYKLLLDDWRGYLISFFALAFVANSYLNLYSRLRGEITYAKTETKKIEKEVERKD